MRKRIAIGAALIATMMTIGLLLVIWARQSPDPEVGMSFADVQPTLKRRFDKVYFVWMNDNESGRLVCCSCEPDFFGNSRELYLRVNYDDRIVWVQSKDMPPERPPWLDRTLKAIGW
jgi:hypothetical protein